MKSRLFSQRTLWIVIVIIFSAATAASVYEAVQDPSRENLAGVSVKVGIIVAMIYVARRDLREMDAER